MRSVALTIVMCMVAVLPSPNAVQAQNGDWTSSTEAKAHWNLAYQAMRADDNSHAAEEFRLATQADPKFAEAYYYRGLVLVLQAFAKEKKTTPGPEAAECFQMYLALKPKGILATDSFSMLKELGSGASSEEVTRNANTILAAKPKSAPQTATTRQSVEVVRAENDPRKTNSMLAEKPQQSVATQRVVTTPKPVAEQGRVETAREVAMTKPLTQNPAALSSRPGDPVAAADKTSRGAGQGQSSHAATSALLKPSGVPLAASTIPGPVAASTQCVRYEITRSGQCGTTDGVEIRAWNPCAQPSAIQVCVQETSGHWSCAMSLHSRQRKTYTGVDGARQYVCHGTGRTRALSLPSGRDMPLFPPVSQ